MKENSLESSDRRSFLKQTGRILIGFNLLPLAFCTLKAEDGEEGYLGPPRDKGLIDSWIRIGADGQVTVLTGKMELGQGIKTAIMQIAAEELDVEMDRVSI
ncbi:MAG TPA: molybdopterin cofactor-binding domain-containing protein, partial [Anditalea sp.]|nr:molybdopterin cofactor-binding domain-containing protein [Anditalea sp.]